MTHLETQKLESRFLHTSEYALGVTVEEINKTEELIVKKIKEISTYTSHFGNERTALEELLKTYMQMAREKLTTEGTENSKKQDETWRFGMQCF